MGTFETGEPGSPATSRQPVLLIEGLEMCRGTGAAALRICLPHLELTRGEILALTGESGCGKSTLLEGIGLVFAPKSLKTFALLPDQIGVAALLKEKRAKCLAGIRASRLGFMMQTGGLLPYLTIRENIMLPRRLNGLVPFGPKIKAVIQILGLEAQLDKHPETLSIGERQRAAFARAVAHRPDILLADEPTAALDPATAQRLFELMAHLARKLGLAMLIVSHDHRLIDTFGIPRLHARIQPGETSFVPAA